jgi:WhiB family transcriptional regulator, redox-sensing transcriptional regulator
MRAVLRDTIWMAQGGCRDVPPETMFPSDSVGVRIACQVCARCPVQALCLDYALDNHIDHGVWGGTSERQRRRINRHQKAPSAPLVPSSSEARS